jgi:Skp family chaperone for outer membrane proteins
MRRISLRAALRWQTWIPFFLPGVLLCCVASTKLVLAQDSSATAKSDSVNDSVRDLQQQVNDLRKVVQQVQTEAARSREETAELRKELEAARKQSNPADPIANAADGSATSAQVAAQQATSSSDDRIAKLDEEYQLLTGKIDDQYQTKVESWSKYRVRFSGIVLFNLFDNIGAVDNIDIPSFAYPQFPGTANGSFGATLRQSQLGFAVTGPQFLGARTSADIRLDFGGGFASVPNGVNYGLAWLRTGIVRMDWSNTSLVAGQDALFFSPTNPTSFASLSTPALAYAGNLWSYTPQIRIEHRFEISDQSRIMWQAGLLDNLDGAASATSAYRVPTAGESSRQPAYATRVSWTHSVFGQPLTIGAAGYYGRQTYGYGRDVDSWAAMTDWSLPLQRMITFSGKLYRGRAVGGLGGALGDSVLVSGDLSNPTTVVNGTNSAGGWAQFKFHPLSTLELNAAFGLDNPFASDFDRFPNGGIAPVYLIRNQGSLVNVIYRPRSDLLFSAEYHYLKTFSIGFGDYTASQFNLMMGVLF